MSNIVPTSGADASALPVPYAQARRAQRQAELTVFRHGLAAAVKAQCDIRDSQAIGEAARASLDEEIDLLEWGLYLANGSAAKRELVVRKVEMFSSLNNRRISRRFGA